MTSGSEKRKRKRVLPIRFSDEELALLRAAAEAAGLTPSSYARQIILGGSPPRPARRRSAESGDLARILGHIGKIGSNVNQLSRNHNMQRENDPAELVAIRRALDAIRAVTLTSMGRQA